MVVIQACAIFLKRKVIFFWDLSLGSFFTFELIRVLSLRIFRCLVPGGICLRCGRRRFDSWVSSKAGKTCVTSQEMGFPLEGLETGEVEEHKRAFWELIIFFLMK